MRKLLRSASSSLVGWVADRRVPGPLRRLVYGAYCRATGADASEARLDLRAYPSLGAFFVRRLLPDARPLDPDPSVLICPCDGTLQDVSEIRGDGVLQAKGRPYAMHDLLAGAAEPGSLDGGFAWTVYLSPRDYHRVHAPEASRLREVRWVPGDRRPVRPRLLERVGRVLVTNERAVLVLDGPHGVHYLVMVGALNVGRIRVVGVPYGTSPTPDEPLALERGGELARFEMGSTVVLVYPPGAARPLGLEPRQTLLLGQPIGAFGA